MKSYDLVLEVSEDFINRSLNVFYEEKIIPLDIQGEHRLKLPLLTGEYDKLDYRLSFNEPPTLDALDQDQISVKYNADVSFKYILLKFAAKIQGHMKCKPTYNRGLNQLELNIIDIDLEKVKILETVSLPDFLVDTLDEVITKLLKNELTNMDNIPIAPIIGNLELPHMPEGNRFTLPIGFGDIQITNKNKIKISFNIAAEGTGAQTDTSESNFDGDIVFRTSESSIAKIINFWWKHTTLNKTIPYRGRIEIKNIESLLDQLSNYSVELLPKIMSMGFIELDWDLIDIWLDYEGAVELFKPKVILEEGSMRLEVNSKIDLAAVLRIELDAAVQLDTSGPIPDAITPWNDDRTIGKGRRILDTVRYSARGKQVTLVDPSVEIMIDQEQRILLEISSFDLDLGLNWRLPRRLIRHLEKNIEKHIRSEFSVIPISPSVVRHEIENTDLLMELDIQKIMIKKNSVMVFTNIDYKKD